MPKRTKVERLPPNRYPFSDVPWHGERTVFLKPVTDERGNHSLVPVNWWAWRSVWGMKYEEIGCNEPGGDEAVLSWLRAQWYMPSVAIMYPGHTTFIK